MLGDNFIRAANGAVFKLDAEKILFTFHIVHLSKNLFKLFDKNYT